MRKRTETIELTPWSYDEHPRVLIEHPDPDDALELAIAIRRVGCVVGICRGPDGSAESPTRCPLHGLEPCEAVAGADLVVTGLDLDSWDGRRVVQGLRTRYPDTPLVVLAPPDDALGLGDLLADCVVVPGDAEPDEVAKVVLGALSA
jgi:hypothetical protein